MRSATCLAPCDSRSQARAPPRRGGGGGGALAVFAARAGVQRPRRLLSGIAAAEAARSSLDPYIVWEKIHTVEASWDSREHVEDEEEELEAHLVEAGARGVRLEQVRHTSGVECVRLVCACAADRGVANALAAAILEATPAVDVTMSEQLRCSLPQRRVHVPTKWGFVHVVVSLKGGEMAKASAGEGVVTPDWGECERLAVAALQESAAAAAGAGGGGGAAGAGDPPAVEPSAEAVASSAVAALYEGVENGTIPLGVQFMF
ncbi:hypothetical protein Rsub_06324 [Raphidocelis subcapitata]|uniref:Uncharacterized protein n=1 Tax=Raphidocelis subcapitata TaxID=307507 RepID=A0A2V0P167_9CHLO|nr:hypothetical protein Rsub_06324 [Raphidocelis subcapitata]|eukprot:GBF93604.1 hypothetical protein Rsub_06324 [Raphidocelis subcapitata]